MALQIVVGHSARRLMAVGRWQNHPDPADILERLTTKDEGPGTNDRWWSFVCARRKKTLTTKESFALFNN
jgi:hypothetical protein